MNYDFRFRTTNKCKGSDCQIARTSSDVLSGRLPLSPAPRVVQLQLEPCRRGSRAPPLATSSVGPLVPPTPLPRKPTTTSRMRSRKARWEAATGDRRGDLLRHKDGEATAKRTM